jgi:hypothetical protein
MLGWALIAGVGVSILAPSCQHICRTAYRTVPLVVTDAKTGQPIRGASVTFDRGADFAAWTSATDASGASQVDVAMTTTGTRFDPIYNSLYYSAEGVPLKIEASGYSPRLVQIPDQREWTILGMGRHPLWRMSVSLDPATTAPSQE